MQTKHKLICVFVCVYIYIYILHKLQIQERYTNIYGAEVAVNYLWEEE